MRASTGVRVSGKENMTGNGAKRFADFDNAGATKRPRTTTNPTNIFAGLAASDSEGEEHLADLSSVGSSVGQSNGEMHAPLSENIDIVQAMLTSGMQLEVFRTAWVRRDLILWPASDGERALLEVCNGRVLHRPHRRTTVFYVDEMTAITRGIPHSVMNKSPPPDITLGFLFKDGRSLCARFDDTQARQVALNAFQKCFGALVVSWWEADLRDTAHSLIDAGPATTAGACSAGKCMKPLPTGECPLGAPGMSATRQGVATDVWQQRGMTRLRRTRSLNCTSQGGQAAVMGTATDLPLVSDQSLNRLSTGLRMGVPDCSDGMNCASAALPATRPPECVVGTLGADAMTMTSVRGAFISEDHDAQCRLQQGGTNGIGQSCAVQRLSGPLQGSSGDLEPRQTVGPNADLSAMVESVHRPRHFSVDVGSRASAHTKLASYSRCSCVCQ